MAGSIRTHTPTPTNALFQRFKLRNPQKRTLKLLRLKESQNRARNFTYGLLPAVYAQINASEISLLGYLRHRRCILLLSLFSSSLSSFKKPK
ncbi:hypothetical protein GJ744_002850 [Endocarpon pusillum]|uniref:Uncharacterized protein n=1 Tax=Endocarpon pusillum TaxID=364733 RepID=A0A8H7E083_9EURO|nr:hypothetical protein GJ744_002850 [Endocarpon pusillum]